MDAMILAAGLGTRLGTITEHTPKALVDVAGRSALEHVARRLIEAGADRLIINLHHHAQRIVAHVEERGGFGADVVFSHEEGAPLETGGGVLAAAPLFRRDAPFFLHNVDVLTDADLRAMYDAHLQADALATLAVSDRHSSRTLLFDDYGLFGRADARADTTIIVRTPSSSTRQWAFAGIHVVSPSLLDRFVETGAFSIMQAYLRLAGEGAKLSPFDITGATWLEIGTPERLEAARRAIAG
jgi:N-acetyl-alpha-D-muramate 1-phosphate uridylyltransferase